MAKPYYQTKESVEEYIQLAKDVNGMKLIERLRRFLPPQSTLLEIGTGPGTDWDILSKEYKVTGSDFSGDFLDHLASTYPNGQFKELNATTLATDEKFDGIYSNKVLHHLKDDEFADSIKRQYEVLNPNGIICHSFWKGEGSEIFKGLFVNYHTETGLRHFFEEHFEVLLLEEYAEFEDSDSLLLLGRKVRSDVDQKDVLE